MKNHRPHRPHRGKRDVFVGMDAHDRSTELCAYSVQESVRERWRPDEQGIQRTASEQLPSIHGENISNASPAVLYAREDLVCVFRELSLYRVRVDAPGSEGLETVFVWYCLVHVPYGMFTNVMQASKPDRRLSKRRALVGGACTRTYEGLRACCAVPESQLASTRWKSATIPEPRLHLDCTCESAFSSPWREYSIGSALAIWCQA